MTALHEAPSACIFDQMRVRLSGILALLLVGCGGNARDSGDAASHDAGAGSAAAGTSGSTPGDGGSAASTVGGAGGAGTSHSAGAAAVSHPARACESAMPRARGGGYSVCADGSLRREQAAACESSLPRPSADLPLFMNECATDSDCSASPHGFCAYGACKYGCVVDAECAVDQACFCGNAIGVCVPATCHDDADCPADFPCTAFQAPGFDAPDSLACQSPTDECLTDAQCQSPNSRVSCKVEDGRRICFQDTIG